MRHHWWAKSRKSDTQREKKSQYYRGSRRLSKEVHGKGFLDSVDQSPDKESFHRAGRLKKSINETNIDL